MFECKLAAVDMEIVHSVTGYFGPYPFRPMILKKDDGDELFHIF